EVDAEHAMRKYRSLEVMPLVGCHEKAAAVAWVVITGRPPLDPFDGGAAVRTRSRRQLSNVGVGLTREVQGGRDWHERRLVDRTRAGRVSNHQLHSEA